MKFYSVRSLAEELSLEQTIIYRMIRSGRIKSHKIGRVYRVSQSQLDAFLETVIARPTLPAIPP